MRLRYWIKTALTYSLTMVGASLIYGAVMGLSGDIMSMKELFRTTGIYLLVFGVMMNLILGMSIYKSNLPLAISFGSSRKEVFLGLQCFSGISIGVILAASTLLFLMAGKYYYLFPMRRYIPLALALLLIAGAAGKFLGVLSVKLGRYAMVLVGVIVGLLICLCFIAGVMVGLGMEISESRLDLIAVVLPVIGAAFYGVSMIPEYKTVYKYNVKL